jgi:hypothetical protein
MQRFFQLGTLRKASNAQWSTLRKQVPRLPLACVV